MYLALNTNGSSLNWESENLEVVRTQDMGSAKKKAEP